MCVACIEFLKDKLTLKEFQSALKETTIDDPKHLSEVSQSIRDAGDDLDEVKRKLGKTR